MSRKFFCIFSFILFALFTYWQLNDLDQYGTQWWQGWVLTYGCTSLLCLASAFVAFPRWVFITGAVLAIAHAFLRFTAIQFEETILFNYDNPAGNETGGLLIVCIWLITLAFWKKKLPKEH